MQATAPALEDQALFGRCLVGAENDPSYRRSPAYQLRTPQVEACWDDPESCSLSPQLRHNPLWRDT